LNLEYLGAQSQFVARARRPARRAQRQPRRGRASGCRRPAVSNALCAAALQPGRSAVGARRARHGADRTRARAGGAAAGRARAARAGSVPAPPFDPATARPALHAHHQRLRRLHAAAPAAGAACRARRPACACRSAAGKSTTCRPILERGEADLMLGIHGDEPRRAGAGDAGGAVPPAHRQAPLFEDRFVCVARKGHPLVRGKLSLATYIKLAPRAGVAPARRARRGRRRAGAQGAGAHGGAARVALPARARDHRRYRLRRRAERARGAPVRRHLAAAALATAAVAAHRPRQPEVWHERNHASPAQAWLRQVITDSAAPL